MERHLRVGELLLDPISHVVYRNGVRIDLAPRQFAVLEYLMRHPGMAVPRGIMLAHAWGRSPTECAQSVDVCIRHIRARLDDAWPVKVIRTVRGVGYMVVNSPKP